MRAITVTAGRRTQIIDITRQMREAYDGSTGAAAVVYVPPTTAGVTHNEHADPTVARDIEIARERIVPEESAGQHIEGGEENEPSHPRGSIGPPLLVPLREREFALCTWHGMLGELDGPRTRSVYVGVSQS